MRVFKNILIAVGLLVGAVALSIVINVLIPPGPGSSGSTTAVVWLMILGTSLWAAMNSHQLEFRSYKTSMPYHPASIFLAHLLLWIVVFPWFLTVRARIKDGSAELKDEFKRMPYPSSASRLPGSGSSVPSAAQGPRPSGAEPERVPPPMPPSAKRPAPTPVPASSVPDLDRLARLQKLVDFKAQGILTDEEFQAEKRRLLG